MRRLMLAAAHCAAVLLTFSSVFASNAKVISFEEQTSSLVAMPDGCTNPFREAIVFINFFHSSIENMAAKRGAKGYGVVDLFAAYDMRNILNEETNMNAEGESPADRLIVTQLCHFEKINTSKNVGKGAQALQINNDSSELHDHLAAISSKLLNDLVELYKEAVKSKKEAEAKNKKFVSQMKEVRRAKRMGAAKVEKLID